MKTIVYIYPSLLLALLNLAIINTGNAQVRFSLATDVSLLHNFDGKQSFTVLGQTLHGQWHTDNRNTLYAWFTYHRNGHYNTDLAATAKSSSIQPQSIPFTNNAEMRLRHLSIGFKRYLLGSYRKLEKFNLYGAAGFGLMMGRASNNFSVSIDTSRYLVQDNIINGSGAFKRISLDLTAGWELPLAYEIFVFSEARIHIPTTDYPNKYLLKNNHAPFPGSINFGFHILFSSEQ